MRLRKSVLRECARLALEGRGFKVELISGPGIVPGARLRAIKGSEEREIAVRSSLDREVGLTRRPNGAWATPGRQFRGWTRSLSLCPSMASQILLKY
jgi:hypothetical protein